MKHDAIIVTSWNSAAIEAAAAMAKALMLQVLGPSAEAFNGFRTMLVCPDGSKEGWDASDAFDSQRAAFIKYLNDQRYEDDSSNLEWVALAYGDSMTHTAPAIVRHSWEDFTPPPPPPPPPPKEITP